MTLPHSVVYLPGYPSTPDRRARRAHDFFRRGYRMIVPGWSGVGRGAALWSDDATGEVVAEASAHCCTIP